MKIIGWSLFVLAEALLVSMFLRGLYVTIRDWKRGSNRGEGK
jgi:hypothetical protein